MEKNRRIGHIVKARLPSAWRPDPMTPRQAFRILATAALALGSGWLCSRLQVPLPWMIGPLAATSLASILGAATASWNPARNAGQWMIATALGLYFTPAVTALVLQLWWAVLLAIAWALLLGWGFGLWLHRVGLPGVPGTPRALRATTYFAGAIGGASEMTLLAEREGARTDLVASGHSLRLLIVTIVVPVAFAVLGLHGLDPAPPGMREVRAEGLFILLSATLAGAGVASLGRGANPWFMGALVVAMGLTMSGVQLSALPTWAINAAQLFIGISLGVRFRREFVGHAPRWLAAVALGTLAMIVLCAGAAALLAQLTGLHPATLVLGMSPGGISEMAITAKVLQMGVPVVTAFQVCRLIAVLLLVEPAYRWLCRPA